MKKNKIKIPEHELFPDIASLERFLDCNHSDPHSILGMHYVEKLGSIVVRVYDPFAEKIFIIFDDNSKNEMEKVHPEGLFAIKFNGRKNHFAYKIEKRYSNNTFLSEDPYCFLPGIGEMDIYLFNEGEHRKIYEIMGSHLRNFGGVEGTLFTVWAPNAQRVSVVGDFNCWDGRRHMMRLIGVSGIWELFIPSLKEGEIYKFEIKDRHGNILLKLDPYANKTELRPRTAAIINREHSFKWSDHVWMEARKHKNWLESPVNIYEVHLASWQHPKMRKIDQDNEDDFHNYRELAHVLADYLNEMGYTHIELLPVAEHPFDPSWGYQVTGFYAPTARYGTPEDFAYFVNYLHNRGIGIFLDWVPAHFPKDAFSLGRFDGTALYEHEDPRQGEHKDWGTYIFNFGRCEVRNFLMGNALYWLDRFHIDGLRVDAVASMLYLDYSRENGEWIPNKYGGNENLDAISFLKRLNELTHELYPGSLMIAEESTAWPMVSRPVYLGGLGFSNKWNMGWMHDTLEYFSKDPVYRSYEHNKLTFSMLYAFTENFILPLSHDEVVHGKHSLIDKMPGDYAQKFANLRSLFVYMITHPGKKLLFMGGEIGQWNEWYSKRGLDWNILDFPAHKSLQTMIKDLNGLYKASPSLWEDDFTPGGFEWIDCSDYQQSVYSFIRWDKRRSTPYVVVMNLTPLVRDNYTIGMPFGGKWVEIFNTDNQRYGGSGILNGGEIQTCEGCFHNRPYHVKLKLPWLGAIILRPQ
ncbi:MAG: 1,4-alpha-glucan branching enzyme [Lentisphaerae bacterium GWF2_44_16]|nr:MAG: 1,4-alpha-glucan branching enzyme [Lentisphaerae bacterium GWF2_44_16]